MDGRIDREVVLIEWKDRNTANATFEGTARELLRLQHPTPIHPMGEMTFNPVARPGDPDWRVMYIGSGDAGTGEQRDSRRLNPQRLDTLVGKILRIVPDLREHTATSTVSENGRYRIPNDNPFSARRGRATRRSGRTACAIRTGWSGMLIRRTVHRAGSVRLQHRARRVGDGRHRPEGRELRLSAARRPADDVVRNGMGPVPEDDTIPIQISDTVVRGTVKPTYPVIQYPHMAANGGDAIAGGFVYRGS